MGEFEAKDAKSGLTMKLWRGERMCLIGFDVAQPEPDFVGFAIECKEPGQSDFQPLLNRIAFSYDKPPVEAVTGKRIYSSLDAPFQKFRWVHFPQDPKNGDYRYRATKLHMPQDDKLIKGDTLALTISLAPVTYDGFLDIGFTRGFASSQAFIDKFPDGTDIDKAGAKIIPGTADEGLAFSKATQPPGIYKWMGFEAHDLLFAFLKQAADDTKVTVDAFTYDFNEPDVVALLKKLGSRLRIIVDDSKKKNKKTGEWEGHATPGSAESQAAKILKAAGATVKRAHFNNLQHNKVFIAKRSGNPVRVLCGSTNHTYRGLYIQSNNVLVFDQPEIAGLFAQYFQAALDAPTKFSAHELASKWHVVQTDGKPAVHICFSPHKDAGLSLNPVGGAIDQATSSVLYNVAFLNQIQSGPTKKSFDRLMTRDVFSYGVSDKTGGLELKKPDGSRGLVDFSSLAAKSPQPFKREWRGQRGINVHHKFVVTDFSLSTAKVFTGSSNLAVSGEEGNGDHLIMIEDRKIAIGYALEALRIFDHLHFRNVMDEAKKKPAALLLRKPKKFSGKAAWFESSYIPDSQRAKDRELFST